MACFSTFVCVFAFSVFFIHSECVCKEVHAHNKCVKSESTRYTKRLRYFFKKYKLKNNV